MARAELDLVPIVDEDGALAGVVTERALARRYIRESRETSSLQDAPTSVAPIVEVLEGELVAGEDTQLAGRVWVHSMDIEHAAAGSPTATSWWSATAPTPSGSRSSSASRCWSLSNGSEPPRRGPGARARARRRGDRLAAGHLRLGPDDHAAAPCRALMEPRAADGHHRRPGRRHRRAGQGDPLRRRGRGRRRPPPGRARHALDLVRPSRAAGAARRPRRAGPERARRRAGRDRRDPRPPPHRLDRDAGPGDGDVRPGRLDRDAGGRALPPERAGAEPPHRDDAARRGAVGHGDPELRDDDRARPRGGRVPRARARDRRDRVRPRDVRGDLRRLGVSAEQIISRDAKEYQGPAATRSASPRSRSSATRCSSARTSCWRRCARARESRDLQLYALMVTDILTKGTELLVAGDTAAVARAFGVEPHDSADRAARGDEPQEGGRAEAVGSSLRTLYEAPAWAGDVIECRRQTTERGVRCVAKLCLLR